jgi:hypothetical protein
MPVKSLMRMLGPILAFCAIACAIVQPKPGTVTGVVHGVKHYDATHLGPPLANREVTLINSYTGDIAARTKTDSEGRFSFTVQPGTYSLWGGERAEYVDVKAGQTSTVELTAPEK